MGGGGSLGGRYNGVMVVRIVLVVTMVMVVHLSHYFSWWFFGVSRMVVFVGDPLRFIIGGHHHSWTESPSGWWRLHS